MLAPSSRASILIAAAPGQTLTLSTAHFCEGTLAFFQTRQELLHIVGTAQAAGDPGPSVTSAPASAADSPASKLVAYAHANPSLIHRRAITFTEYVFPKHGNIPPHTSYYITDTTNANFHEHPYYPLYNKGGSVPANADIVVKQGAIEEWYLFNTTMESHVFHIHQMAFVEKIGPAGVPATVDSMFVPVGQLLANPYNPNYPFVKPSVTKVLLDFRNVPRGTFVFHCHMLFHEDRGMMGVIRVV
jgi:FtsP/CotA-like multicopper oxidase with cupredoxin domain